MVFSSIAFLFYFLPLFFLLYYIADRRVKNIVILAGSLLFYALGAPKFVFVVVGGTTVDFFIVRSMYRAEHKTIRKLLLAVSIYINLGLLVYFKYSHFIVDNLNALYKMAGVRPVSWVKLVLPLGISFYTFETITYAVDVYRGIHQPFRRVADYLLYITLFPKLIAGPITRYHDFAGQVHDHTAYETPENILRGFYRFCLGLGKKALIANTLGVAVNAIFLLPPYAVSTGTAWMGALSYTFQIYFDFSGYTDMAIGLGLMMGFRLPENFNNPYTALSVTDFWRRWHITLGAWMREYLYIPLGGNRVSSKWRLYANLGLVFLLSGLWHGAAWGFVIWGAYHGLFMILERLFLGQWLSRLGKFACLYTFPVVLVGWVFFRVENLSRSVDYLKNMFCWHPDHNTWLPEKDFFTILAIAIFFSFITLTGWGQRLQQRVFYTAFLVRGHYLMVTTSLLLLIISAGRIASSTFNPFIYFRF